MIPSIGSIGGRDLEGQNVEDNLSCLVMESALVMWGNRAAQVGGNISPSRFLEWNSSHFNVGMGAGPLEENTLQTNHS